MDHLNNFNLDGPDLLDGRSGPLGALGGFGIMQLRKVAFKVFAKTHTLDSAGGNAGEILYVLGWLIALIMWGFGIVWLFFALASISCSKFRFNMGWWGFTFPLGNLLPRRVSWLKFARENE